MASFNGLGMHLGNLPRLSNAKTRSITAENPTGEKGKGGMAVPQGDKHPSRLLGQGWKVRPQIGIEPGETATIADIVGPGAIQHIWMTPTKNWRLAILRVYWDDQEQPSIECPLGDFFASAMNRWAQISSLPVCVNPGAAFNCYWEMPFRKRCRMTVENLWHERMSLYYQIDYTLTEVPEYAAYFHAQFRRVRHVPCKEVYTILDGVRGHGQYVGTYILWSANDGGWWGEGEIKFYIDGDGEFPTLCGTGTEDYFCGSYDFNPGNTWLQSDRPSAYVEFTTPYAGLPLVYRPDGVYNSQTKFSLYRWHIMDPVRFEQDLRVTIQDLGITLDGRFRPREDDLASVAFWYQTLPTAPFPPLPDRDYLEPIARV
ncbi:MAG TPA: glycoside hydrolase family 172 protein [Fimbriimonadaceae bacterium]|nr:glycoside hydrolase family 172 protein [Fimbriimonadaceae bacterium]